jgi:hypothetical protein
MRGEKSLGMTRLWIAPGKNLEIFLRLKHMFFIIINSTSCLRHALPKLEFHRDLLTMCMLRPQNTFHSYILYIYSIFSYFRNSATLLGTDGVCRGLGMSLIRDRSQIRTIVPPILPFGPSFLLGGSQNTCRVNKRLGIWCTVLEIFSGP